MGRHTGVGQSQYMWGRICLITIEDFFDDLIREAAKKTEGFSGREIAKLMASVQAIVYGRLAAAVGSLMIRITLSPAITPSSFVA